MEFAVPVVAAVVALVFGLIIGRTLGKKKGQASVAELSEKLSSETAAAESRVEEATGVHRLELEAKEAAQKILQGELAEAGEKAETLEEELADAKARIETLETERLRFRRFADGHFKEMLEQFLTEWKKSRLPLRVEELLEAKEPSQAALGRLEALAAPMQQWMNDLGIGSAETYFHLGLWYLQQDRMREAIESFGEATDKGMGFEAWLARGDFHWHQDRPEKAREAYRRCLRADGMPDRAYFRTAAVAIDGKRFKQGLAALETLLGRNSKHPVEVYTLASLAAGKLERYERAVEICEAGLKHHPKSNELRGDLIIPLAKLGRLDEAEEKYLEVNESDPTYAKPIFAMGVVRMIEEEHPGAIRFLEEAIELDPELAEAHFCRGVIENRNQRFKPALGHFRRAIEIKPDYAEAFYNMKDSYEGLRKFDEAIAALDQATRLRPDFK